MELVAGEGAQGGGVYDEEICSTLAVETLKAGGNEDVEACIQGFIIGYCGVKSTMKEKRSCLASTF